jgi:hypothetical protein
MGRDNSPEEICLDDGEEHILYNPVNYWDQAGQLIDIYKPHINPSVLGTIVVEILREYSENKTNVTLEYAVAKTSR